MLLQKRPQCVWRCVTDKAAPRAFIPGAATRTGLNWRQPGPWADSHPMARGANQSALTIDLQENANAAAVTCQRERPAGGRRPRRSRLWHDRPRGPPSRAPGTACAAAAALDAGGPASDAGLGTCMVCGLTVAPCRPAAEAASSRSGSTAVSRAPSSQQARRSSRLGSPTTATGYRRPLIPGYRSPDALRRLSNCMSPDRSPAPRGRTDRAAPG